MGRSHVQRRRREQQPLRRLRGSVRDQLDWACSVLEKSPDEAVQRGLIDEVVAAASPYVFHDRDAVIPAEREDLMRAYLLLRLLGVLGAQAEITGYLRRTAPAPDDGFCPGVRSWSDPTCAEVRAAYASRRRRQARERVEVTN